MRRKREDVLAEIVLPAGSSAHERFVVTFGISIRDVICIAFLLPSALAMLQGLDKFSTILLKRTPRNIAYFLKRQILLKAKDQRFSIDGLQRLQ